MINRDRLLKRFLDLVSINSPSLNEREMADVVMSSIKELGFNAYEDDAGSKLGGNAGNIIGYLEGESKTGIRLLLSAHLDTVESTEGIAYSMDENGLIKSSGNTILGADDKAGISVILEAVQTALENKIPFRSIQLVFDVDEERGLGGARLLKRENLKADLAYVFDTEKPVASVVISAPSHNRITFTMRGKAAHAGISPEQGRNAIVAAAKGISSMHLGRIDYETTANVGVIRGGKAQNIVPDFVEVFAEARSRNDEKLEMQTANMVNCMKSAAAECETALDVDIHREFERYNWSSDDLVVKLAVKAAKSVGIDSQLIGAGGGSDANIFNTLGLPAVVLGVGYEHAHTSDECILIDDLVKTADFAVALIKGSTEENC